MGEPLLEGPARVICVAHGYEDDAVFVKFVGSCYDDDGWMDSIMKCSTEASFLVEVEYCVWCFAGKGT